MARLKDRYEKEILPALMERFGFTNVWQAPRLEKLSINMGVGKAKEGTETLDAAVKELTAIAGQKVVITKAKKSISAFGIRMGMPIGCRVTLRGQRMWEFTDRLFSIALPRIRDFRGLSPNSFDGRGNYSFGLDDQLIFPELGYDDIERQRGMEITFVTTARTDEEARALLELLGLPFTR
ncbi:MAG: 50S ribosomal protein L5 [Armatimonadota bacterium]